MLIVNASQIITLKGRRKPFNSSGQLSGWARRGLEMRDLGILHKGHAIFIEGENIRAIGAATDIIKRFRLKDSLVWDAKGGVVLPGFVDSHTHAAFAAPRLRDFEFRLQGFTYQEIVKKGGGIIQSVRDLRQLELSSLVERLNFWCAKAVTYGTTTMEVKSGYGLSFEEEKKILLAIKKTKGITPLELVATFLGAHAVGPEYLGRRELYVEEIINRMLPDFSSLAVFCDVFCDKDYFTLEEAKRILKRARELGYGLKIHAEQISRLGGSRLAAECKATSADHLDWVNEKDIKTLAASSTVCVLVPGSNFFLGMTRYPPARRLIEGGAAVALATDFNPGTSPTLFMPAILSIAVTQMKMTVEEALAAATINGACALGLEDTHGSLEAGKQADLIIAEANDYRELPYYFAMNPVTAVIKKGRVIYSSQIKAKNNKTRFSTNVVSRK